MGYAIVLLLVTVGLIVLFKWFAGKDESPSNDNEPIGSIEGPGRFKFDIVGESHYQRALKQIAGPKRAESKRHKCVATLVLEDDNPHDDMAVRVDIEGETVGHLDRRMARQFRAELARQGISVRQLRARAVIVGGWRRGTGDSGSYGVKLDLPLTD